MEALLRSFVAKVNAHALLEGAEGEEGEEAAGGGCVGCVADETPGGGVEDATTMVRILLSMLHPTTHPDTVEVALTTLVHVTHHAPEDLFEQARGVETLVSYLSAYEAADAQHHGALAASRPYLVTLLGLATAPALLREIHQHDPAYLVPTLLELHLTPPLAGNACMHALALLEVLLNDPACAACLGDEHALLLRVTPLIGMQVLDDPHLSRQALRTLLRLAHDDAAGRAFWRVGRFLVPAVARHRLAGAIDAGDVAEAVAHLCTHAPAATEAELTELMRDESLLHHAAMAGRPHVDHARRTVLAALEQDLLESFDAVALDRILSHAGLRAGLATGRIASHATLLLSTHGAQSGEPLLRMLGTLRLLLLDLPRGEAVDGTSMIALFDRLFDVETVATLESRDDGGDGGAPPIVSPREKRVVTLAVRTAALLCLSVSRVNADASAVARRFPSMVLAWRRGVEVCPEEAHDLERHVLQRFYEIVANNAELAMHPVRVHGGARDVPLHLLRWLLGDAPLREGTMLHTGVRRYAADCLARLPRPLTPGLRRLARDLHQRLRFDRALLRDLGGGVEDDGDEPARWWEGILATCPIALEYLHFPVMLSDGHTYELESVMRCLPIHATSWVLRSPLTRAAVRPWVVYNRQLVDMERALVQSRPPAPPLLAAPSPPAADGEDAAV